MGTHRRGRNWALVALAWAGLLIVVGPTGAVEDKPATVVDASEARNHVDETCTVEMTVRSSKNAAGRREYYLDSEPDFRDAKNLAVVISYDHADKFREAGISDPAEHFRNKTVQVTGKIIREAEQVRIRVEDPKMIKVVDETTK